MKCKILHETTGRLRVHLCCGRMTVSQADVLEYTVDIGAQAGTVDITPTANSEHAVV